MLSEFVYEYYFSECHEQKQLFLLGGKRRIYDNTPIPLSCAGVPLSLFFVLYSVCRRCYDIGSHI